MDPVTQEKIGLSCCTSIEQTTEIFAITATEKERSSGRVSLTWQFFANSNPHALISEVTSYYHFSVEIHSEFSRSITIFMCEIVEGVVRHRDFVAKLKIPKLFS